MCNQIWRGDPPRGRGWVAVVRWGGWVVVGGVLRCPVWSVSSSSLGVGSVDHRGAALPRCRVRQPRGVSGARVSRDALGAHGGSLIEQDRGGRYVSPRDYFVRSSASPSLVPRHDEAPASLRGIETDRGCRACRVVVSRQRRRKRGTNPSESSTRRRCGSSHTRRNHEPQASWQPRRWRSQCLRSLER